MWIDDHTFRVYSAKKSRSKGHGYELQIIKDLESIGYSGLKSSRSESKNLDSAKIDIADLDNQLDFYIQAKNTANTPSIIKINNEVGKKDKPLAIFWKCSTEQGKEFVIVPKDYFYRLIRK